jgi:hypothetical protein
LTSLTSSGDIYAPNGSTGTPTHTFTSDAYAGLSAAQANNSYGIYLSSNTSYYFAALRGVVSGLFCNGIGTYDGSGGNYLIEDGGKLVVSSSRGVLKENVVAVAVDDALTRIKSLRPVEFNMKKELFPDAKASMSDYTLSRGFIAEEVAAVDHWYCDWGWIDSNDETRVRPYPGAPNDIDDADPDTYDLADAVPLDWGARAMVSDLVAAVQSLSTKLEAAEARLAALEA